MRKTTALLVILLIFGVLACGCTSSGTQTTGAQITPISEPKYSSGDIIYKSLTNNDPCWLILSYDPKTDEYEIAGVFKFDDGSWGYRLDKETDWEKRDFMEDYCPVQIAHVDLSDIKIGIS